MRAMARAVLALPLAQVALAATLTAAAVVSAPGGIAERLLLAAALAAVALAAAWGTVRLVTGGRIL